MLTIDRFRAAYHVPEGAPDREGLRVRLDRLVRDRLPAVIESELGRAPSDADAVYVIRRLHLSLSTKGRFGGAETGSTSV